MYHKLNIWEGRPEPAIKILNEYGPAVHTFLGLMKQLSNVYSM